MISPHLDETAPWFVAQLRPQSLKRALDHLHRQNFPTFSPEMTATSLRAGIAKTVRKPLFPGYLFVSFDPGQQGWAAINSTRGISRLILNDTRHPTPLPQQLVAGLAARCDDTGLILPPPNLEIGDRIRVLAGPFAETVTTIENLPDPARVGILMDLMGRMVKTSLPREHIQKLD